MRTGAVRVGYLMLGILCVGLGFIGYVTPVMPGTVFLLIALWSFKRSSPRLESWLLHHPLVGPTLQNWERDRSMKRSTKILAITMVWVSILASAAYLVRKHALDWQGLTRLPPTEGVVRFSTHPLLWIPPFLILLAGVLTRYLATRRETVQVLEHPSDERP